MLYREIVRHLPDVAILMFDGEYRFLLAEGGALKAQGWQKEMLEGHTLMEVFPAAAVERLRPFYDAALSGVQETFLYAAQGRQYEVVAVPLPPDESSLARGMLVIRDLTRYQDDAASRAEQSEAVQAMVKQATEEVEHFIRHASHDLQAPLRQIVSFAELLEADHGHQIDTDGRELLHHLQQATLRMRRLMGDLLTLARSGSAVAIPEPIDLNLLLQEVLESLDTAGVSITREPLPVVPGSAVLLQILLQNLLENALRYRSPDRPLQIRVSSRWQEGGWEIAVADNGMGIKPEHFERIFLPFIRVHHSSQGSGLGLAACTRIAARHGGHITVESAPDVGSTFRVFLAQSPS